ncbi:hypothetical protein GDO81_011408 [Engystomops pustulosus]|uniref:Uncharacterized protein n=1 Tax=Engystomops pustulosus TaxID=76066 RepID=A0AAV7BEE2_ENGPU|nr:hypothetical protein GDO81_011408 [Engystomops pustulosus]
MYERVVMVLCCYTSLVYSAFILLRSINDFYLCVCDSKWIEYLSEADRSINYLSYTPQQLPFALLGKYITCTWCFPPFAGEILFYLM